ncbi:Major Facilitator Superfamily protein [Microbacterium hydrocarbonoxydans]|uniref:Major Facilitator Superfamily protein n=1 Tax=Microbacterium hydrocarbonoxydans TaxID=273678 RepID=A0A0M2HWV5_9MICO|nr:MFS transporter [Microbacterium hydrocarbonoxydans]KJL48929.1 Major Facilitator Superfamily protein [Microbacterium hydrocarbonoxydans]
MYLAGSKARQDDGDTAVHPPSDSGGVGRRAAGVGSTAIALGAVSLLTDLSSEMVTAVLPLYLVIGLGMTPLAFGFLDGLYNGVTAFVRLLGGHIADRWSQHKLVAGIGYGLSAICKPFLLLSGASTVALSATLAVDRIGKGIRTAPRDALISLSVDDAHQGRAFGVHRAMDTAGALLGPLAAFGLLWMMADAFDAVFIVSFSVASLGVLVLIAFVPGRRSMPVGAPRPTLRETVRILGDAGFRRLLIAASILGLVTVGDGFLYLGLQERMQLDAAFFPLLPLGSALVYLLLAVPMGRLADRIGRRLPFLLGNLALVGAYSTVLLPVDGPLLLVLLLALLGTFYAATDGVLMALAGPRIPRDRRAGGMALLQTGQATGRLFAAVMFGAAWTFWGMSAAFAAAALTMLAVLIGAAVLIRPESRRDEGNA